jgi:hypothetical protein
MCPTRSTLSVLSRPGRRHLGRLAIQLRVELACREMRNSRTGAVVIVNDCTTPAQCWGALSVRFGHRLSQVSYAGLPS